MGLFNRKKKEKEEEALAKEEEEEGRLEKRKKLSSKKFKDLNPESSRRRKAPPKPWGKKERFLVFSVFFVMAITAALLAATARNWKLPGLPKAGLPGFTLEDTIILESPPAITQKNYSLIKTEIENLIRPLSGVYGVYVWDIEAEQGFGVNEHEVMQAASLIKLPVMASMFKEAEKGRLSLSTSYSLKEADKIGGAGSLYYRPAGTQLSYRELIEYMGQQSDNTAYGIAKTVLGNQRINDLIVEVGMTNTSEEENTTTPYEIGLFYRKLWKGQLISSSNRDEMLRYLTNTIYENWIPAAINDPSIKVAHKYGSLVHVINDAGIVFAPKPFILVVMTDGIVEAETTQAFPQIVQIVYNFIQTQ